MRQFPIVSRNHLDRVPRTAVEECAIGSLAGTLLTANTKVGIDFDSSEWWMIFVGQPKHTGFDRAILDTSWRTRTARTTICSYRQYLWFSFTSRLAVADGHRPAFFDDFNHIRLERST